MCQLFASSKRANDVSTLIIMLSGRSAVFFSYGTEIVYKGLLKMSSTSDQVYHSSGQHRIF